MEVKQQLSHFAFILGWSEINTNHILFGLGILLHKHPNRELREKTEPHFDIMDFQEACAFLFNAEKQKNSPNCVWQYEEETECSYVIDLMWIKSTYELA